MKKGSNLLLLMMGVYLVIAIVMLIIFGGPRITKKTVEEPAALSGMIAGDVSDGKTAEQPVQEEQPAEQPAEAAPAVVINDTGAAEEKPAEEPAPEAAEEDNTPHFYLFKANHSKLGLRIRKEPSLQGEEITKILPGTEGVVLERLDEWSRVVTSDGVYTGYCFNQYLALTEITEEEHTAAVEAAYAKAAQAAEEAKTAEEAAAAEGTGDGTQAAPADAAAAQAAPAGGDAAQTTPAEQTGEQNAN
ncbi:MAG: SH3 domain-containing protein [Lachnospiraceae bacterium]|nr:SH3 domain-containing protein [Lachnospiraceae bacterium]